MVKAMQFHFYNFVKADDKIMIVKRSTAQGSPNGPLLYECLKAFWKKVVSFPLWTLLFFNENIEWNVYIHLINWRITHTLCRCFCLPNVLARTTFYDKRMNFGPDDSEKQSNISTNTLIDTRILQWRTLQIRNLHSTKGVKRLIDCCLSTVLFSW